jgi:hypothetical protein
VVSLYHIRRFNVCDFSEGGGAEDQAEYFYHENYSYNFLHIDSIVGAEFHPKRHQVQSRLFHRYSASQSMQRKETNCEAQASAEFFSPHGQFNVHNGAKITEKLEKRHIARAPHPPYSPDLSQRDFWSFGILKQKMKERVSQSEEQILAAIT